MRWTVVLVVDLRLLRLAWRFHIGVANRLGECLRSFLVVKAENVVMKPAEIAFASIDNVGENRLVV